MRIRALALVLLLALRAAPAWAQIGAPRATGVVSSGNSTTATLGISGVFTGTFEEVKDYASISIILFSDQSSAANGIETQWSSNGSDADATVIIGDLSGNTGETYTIAPRARYFRIRFTNGGIAQTTFRLGTTYHPVARGTDLRDAIGNEIATATAAPSGGRGLVVRNIPSGQQEVTGVSGAAITTNLVDIGGATIATNNGASSAAVQRVTIANDSTGQIKATNFPTTVDTNTGAAGASTIRVVQATGSEVAVMASATTTNAASACNILSTASTNATSCKGSAGNFYGYEIFNTTTTVYYLRLYNTAAAPTCSSATGFIRSIPIPPAAAAGGVGGAVSNQVVPVPYGTGIGYCITGGSGSTDNTNAAAGIFGEVRYK